MEVSFKNLEGKLLLITLFSYRFVIYLTCFFFFGFTCSFIFWYILCISIIICNLVIGPLCKSLSGKADIPNKDCYYLLLKHVTVKSSLTTDWSTTGSRTILQVCPQGRKQLGNDFVFVLTFSLIFASSVFHSNIEAHISSKVNVLTKRSFDSQGICHMSENKPSIDFGFLISRVLLDQLLRSEAIFLD